MPFRISHIASAPLALAALSLTACGGGGEGGTTSGGTAPSGSASTGVATLSWLPPSENTDGSSVTSLAGYRVYRGVSESSMMLAQTVSNPGITTVVIEGLATGTHYFAVSAFSAGGLEGDRSTVGSKSIP